MGSPQGPPAASGQGQTIDMSHEDLILQMADLVVEMQRGEERLKKYIFVQLI